MKSSKISSNIHEANLTFEKKITKHTAVSQTIILKDEYNLEYIGYMDSFIQEDKDNVNFNIFLFV